jgi:MoaA/NifB/PqqE/SkfB family radical SAM enzyme
MDEKIRRLKKWMNGEQAPPMTLELNPTNRCNLKCLSCWLREFKAETEELSDERLLNIIEEAFELGIKEVRIPGSGEPLMRKNLMSVMKKIKDYKMNGLLITNGTLLTKSHVKELIEMGWDCITFSIDSADEKTHDYLRGVKGSFRKTLNALKELKKAKEKLKKEKPLIRFNTVLSNKNYSSISKIFELGHKYNCKDIQIQPITIWGDEGQKLRLNDQQIKESHQELQKAQKKSEKYGIISNIHNLLGTEYIKNTNNMDKMIKKRVDKNTPALSLPCFEPWYNLIILPNGAVSHCSISGDKVGENVKNKPLKEIWYGKRFNFVRKSLMNNNLFDYCKQCCVVIHIENQRIKQELLGENHV